METAVFKMKFCVRFLLFCAVFCSFLSLTHAGERVVYRGTLEGAGEVVMELQASEDGGYTGRYFYPRYGKDMRLEGNLTKLNEFKTDHWIYWRDRDVNKTIAIWRGAVKDKVFQGEWRNVATGKKRAFLLKQVAKYKTALEDAFDDTGISYNTTISMTQTPYEYLKLSGHSVPVGEIVGDDTVAYQMWHDPRPDSRFQYPRLVRHPDPMILEKINFLLEQDHWHSILVALECDDKTSVTVNFLSPTLMSYSATGSNYCVGAHPNNYWGSITLDLIRGEELDWNRLFRAFVQGKYRSKEPSPTLLKLVEKLEGSRKYRLKNRVNIFGVLSNDDYYFLTENLVLSFGKPDRLLFSMSGFGHCCTSSNGTYYAMPFSDLPKSFLKPAAQQYLIPSVILKPPGAN